MKEKEKEKKKKITTVSGILKLMRLPTVCNLELLLHYTKQLH